MKVLTCVLVLLVPSLVFCREGCFDFPPVQNFNFTLFKGEWNYLMVNLVPRHNECTMQILQENDQGENSTITFKQLHKEGDKNIAVLHGGPIWETNTPGKLQFIFLGMVPEVVFPYTVLDTDYHNYAVVYICWVTDWIARYFIIVMGRSTSLSAEAQAAVNAVLERTNPIPHPMVEVPHINCPRMPSTDF